MDLSYLIRLELNDCHEFVLQMFDSQMILIECTTVGLELVKFGKYLLLMLILIVIYSV